MKLLLLIPIAVLFSSLSVDAQDESKSQAELSAAPVVEARYEVKSSHAVPLHDGTGRKVIVQRVKPLVLPPPPEVAAPVLVDPVLREARRAAWAREAKKERRIVSLTGIYYPNGQTFLQWFMPGPDGKWTTYEAWTLQDVRAAWLVQEFEVGNTIYNIFPSVHAASKLDRRRDFPGPLWFPEGSSGFRLTKGDPSHAKSMEPIAAFIKIFQDEGPVLTAQWLALKAADEAEQARLKANPPPVLDIIIQVHPYRSSFFPEAEAEYEAALAAGRAQAAASKSR